MVKGKLQRAYYCSAGPMLTVDSLTVEYKVEGEVYVHEIPNQGWSYQTPALRFMAYVGIQPTDFDGGKYIFDGTSIHVVWVDEHSQYLIDDSVFVAGATELKKSDWFNPEGSVWNSDGSEGIGGINMEPGTGNRSGVPVGGGEG